MAMNKSEKEQLAAWAADVRTAASWVSGNRRNKLERTAAEMEAAAGAEEKAET